MTLTTIDREVLQLLTRLQDATAYDMHDAMTLARAEAVLNEAKALTERCPSCHHPGDEHEDVTAYTNEPTVWVCHGGDLEPIGPTSADGWTPMSCCPCKEPATFALDVLDLVDLVERQLTPPDPGIWRCALGEVGDRAEAMLARVARETAVQA